MSNKIVYSCDSSDEGSDMDVSDSDDGARLYTQAQQSNTGRHVKTAAFRTPQKRPYESMVVSLHNFMQRDSWPEQSIKPKVENILPNPSNSIQQDPSSYAAAASQKKLVDLDLNSLALEDDYDSDDSFYTAPSSPEQQKDVEMEEYEPGQIQDSSTTINEFESSIAQLEEQLTASNEKELLIEKELQLMKDRQEAIRIRLLEHQVRRSIARNRKPINPTVKLNGSTTTPSPTKSAQLTPSRDTEVVTAADMPKRKYKGKAPAEPRISPIYQDTLKASTELRQSPISLPAALPEPFINPHFNISHQSVQHNKLDKQKKTKEHSSKIHHDIQHGNRLLDAVIDKPLSKRYNGKEQDNYSAALEPMQAPTERKAKEKQRWDRLGSEKVNEEERRLIAPDALPYEPLSRKGSGDKSGKAHKLVSEYFANNSLSLKQMRLALKNLKDQSILTGALTIEQEEFVASLCKNIIRSIIAYVTMNTTVRINTEINYHHLPQDYYGDFAKLDYTAPDISHAELYKTIRHFDGLLNVNVQRNAMEYLLKSGREPPHKILRTCDPAERDDANATPESDELPNAHVNKKSKKEKAVGKSKRKQANKAERIENKIRLNIENAQLQSDIDRLADQIQLDLKNRNRLETLSRSRQNALGNVQQTSQPAVKPPPAIITIDDYDDDIAQPTNTAPTTLPSTSFNSTAQQPLKQAILVDVYDSDAPRPFAAPITSDELPSAIPNRDHASTNSAIFPPVANIPPIHKPKQRKKNLAKNNVNTLVMQPKIVHTINNTALPEHMNAPEPMHAQSSSAHFQPYRSAISSLGLGNVTQPKPQQAKKSTLCSAESGGGVCNVKNCPFTHFKDFM